METTPRALRLHIGIFGRTNVGKSTFLNLLSGQDLAITSPLPGTTTDPVEKAMELNPLGPVVLIDTAGMDDTSELGAKRLQRTASILQRVDVAALLVESGQWSDYEAKWLGEFRQAGIPHLILITKTDITPVAPEFLQDMRRQAPHVMSSSLEAAARNEIVQTFTSTLQTLCSPRPGHPDTTPASLLDGILSEGETMLLLIPIDSAAPKGRLILPQVQVLRAALDINAAAITTTEKNFRTALNALKAPPDLVVCDSQAVDIMVRETPPDIPCTTFSILFARMKSSLPGMVKAARAIDRLQDGDHILIMEACTHHPTHEDIGRVKIPAWLRQYTGKTLNIDIRAGRDDITDLSRYALIIHCGGCMLTRTEMLARQKRFSDIPLPVTNYGIAISWMKGVLPRVLTPFPDALAELE